jgi:hypothetical protein
MFTRPLRHGLVLTALLLLAAGAAAAAPLRSGASAPRFVMLPDHVLQGASVNVAVAAADGSRCSLAVRYDGGATQPGLTIRVALGGIARWAWQVPREAHAGAARVTARCGGVPISRALVVVGNLTPPKITVVKRGFSIRPFGLGNNVSYGLVLRNGSTTVDAVGIDILVNFVLANGHLIGSARTAIPTLPAGTDFNYGGELNFPGSAPVDHLEVVIQDSGAQKHDSRRPVIDNVVFEPSQFEQAWLGEIDGEVVNDQTALTLTNAQLYAVAFDANGNVLGGTSGASFGALPPGTRQVFKLMNGLDTIPISRVASVAVSTLGTYTAPGS